MPKENEIPPPLEGSPTVVEASTIKEAVAIATEHIEAGQPVNVEVTEAIPEDDKEWKKQTQALLNQLKQLLSEHRNEQTEVRALLTRMDDQLKLVISSRENPKPSKSIADGESSEISPTSEPQPLPLEVPPPAKPADVVDDHPEAPPLPPRKRRKI